MSQDYSLAEETLGYNTAQEVSNTDRRFLVSGSKNVLIDFQKKVSSRGGYYRLGAGNTALTEIRNAWTWFNSIGESLPQRFYDDELEVYLGTVDGTVINAWTRVKDSWSTTEKLRPATWFDATENIDLQIMVIGDANLYEWNGAVAVVDSITATTITKKGTTTWAQRRFYTGRNKVVVCVRTGTEYTYTGGEGTTTITGISDTTGLVSGDILIQKVITDSNKPASSHTNHLIYSFENHIVIGSEDDEEIFISQNDDYDDFTFSSPRVPGEGALFTIEDRPTAINSIGKSILAFGRSSITKAFFEEIAVSTTLAETIRVEKIFTGLNQGALNQESVVPIGDSLAFLTNEVALRIISDPSELTGINPRAFSNPIKPDFDFEDWLDADSKPSAFGLWYKNILFFTAPQSSRMYMLNFVEDADGKLFRFWNPPQTFPVGALSIIDSGDGLELHGHSNAVPETYLLFDGRSDGQYDDMDVVDKLPIHAVAKYAYNNYKERERQKNFDEWYVEGEITTNTNDLLLTLDYNFEGSLQTIERTIDGSDEDILEGRVGINSLAQQSLTANPLGGLLNPPSDARKFRVVFEVAKEDFFEIQDTYEVDEVDIFFSIIARGGNVSISKRKATNIRK